MLNSNGSDNKTGIMWGGIGLFLYGSSGIFFASEVTFDLARALIAITIPTCGWLVQYYVRKLITWLENRNKSKE